MNRRYFHLSVLGAAAFGVRAYAQTAKQTPFEALHTLIRPQPDEEKWAQIPWLTDLWQARKVAYEQGKPIFLWEMDGHPLGCV